jgi:hypothetical protein
VAPVLVPVIRTKLGHPDLTNVRYMVFPKNPEVSDLQGTEILFYGIFLRQFRDYISGKCGEFPDNMTLGA